MNLLKPSGICATYEIPSSFFQVWGHRWYKYTGTKALKARLCFASGKPSSSALSKREKKQNTSDASSHSRTLATTKPLYTIFNWDLGDNLSLLPYDRVLVCFRLHLDSAKGRVSILTKTSFVVFDVIH